MSDVVEASAEETNYDFDAELQTEIVTCLMRDSQFNRRCEGLVLPAYFTDRLEAEFASMAIGFYKKYQDVPSPAAWGQLLKQAFVAKRFRDTDREDAINKFKQLLKLEVRSRTFILDSIAEFAKEQAITQALMASAVELGKAGNPERFEKIERKLRSAMEVALKTEDEDSDYFAEIEERTKTRLENLTNGKPTTGVTTGVKELDAALPMHLGFGKQELSIFLGGAKSGKSFALQFSCASAVLAGYNCLFISLENSVSVANARFDAFFSGVGLNEQSSQPHAVEAGVRKIAESHGIGILKVRRAAAGTFKSSDLEKILEEYSVKGIKFSAIYIDYLDIACPNHRYNDPIENSKSVYIDFRQVAVRWDLAMVSASQVNRMGMNSAVVQATHVSDDINKIRTIDLAIGVSRGESDRAEHKVRLTLAASRNSDDGITIFATTDFNRGRFIDIVESVE